MPVPSEWDFRSLRGQSELKVQDVVTRALVEDAPAVIFLQRTIERALSAAIRAPGNFDLWRDEAVAEILINFARVPIDEPAPVEPTLPFLKKGTLVTNTANGKEFRVLEQLQFSPAGIRVTDAFAAVGDEIVLAPADFTAGPWRVSADLKKPGVPAPLHIRNRTTNGEALGLPESEA